MTSSTTVVSVFSPARIWNLKIGDALNRLQQAQRLEASVGASKLDSCSKQYSFFIPTYHTQVNQIQMLLLTVTFISRGYLRVATQCGRYWLTPWD